MIEFDPLTVVSQKKLDEMMQDEIESQIKKFVLNNEEEIMKRAKDLVETRLKKIWAERKIV